MLDDVQQAYEAHVLVIVVKSWWNAYTYVDKPRRYVSASIAFGLFILALREGAIGYAIWCPRTHNEVTLWVV